MRCRRRAAAAEQVECHGRRRRVGDRAGSRRRARRRSRVFATWVARRSRPGRPRASREDDCAAGASASECTPPRGRGTDRDGRDAGRPGSPIEPAVRTEALDVRAGDEQSPWQSSTLATPWARRLRLASPFVPKLASSAAIAAVSRAMIAMPLPVARRPPAERDDPTRARHADRWRAPLQRPEHGVHRFRRPLQAARCGDAGDRGRHVPGEGRGGRAPDARSRAPAVIDGDGVRARERHARDRQLEESPAARRPRRAGRRRRVARRTAIRPRLAPNGGAPSTAPASTMREPPVAIDYQPPGKPQ